jgi:hypothetical protein
LQTINDFLLNKQHWISALGVLATLFGLWFSYSKMKKRIDQFKGQARAKIAFANLSTTKAAVEELLSVNSWDNLALLHRKIMDLNNMIIHLREQLTIGDPEVFKQLQEHVTRNGIYEIQITNDLQLGSDKLDKRRFLTHLSNLKSLLCVIENEVSVLAKDASHGSK